jgi:hypothetical protein
MGVKNRDRIRETVYVIGAGFSAGLGYPQTKSLLIDVWDRLDKKAQTQLQEIILFHHPSFISQRKTTFPDIEQLLTEIQVNLDLFDASRRTEGGLTKKKLEVSRIELLSTIADWFHELFNKVDKAAWLSKFVKQIQAENAVIISFNWDLVLDKLLFTGGLTPVGYGLSKNLGSGPILLKPHGSLNWYPAEDVSKVDKAKRIRIFEDTESGERVDAFIPPRKIKSTVGKRYTPFIIPPTYLKDFSRPISRRLWRNCTDLLSTPKRLVFLGYSLPTADLHAQFIFRCGFYNQIEGRLKEDGRGRHHATGHAEVIIVNPDQAAAKRIEEVAGPLIPCTWFNGRVEDWLKLQEAKTRI